ncbi:MAG: NADH-quinone oxidoreductase subunit L [Phycisphaerae bacterium]
MSNYETYLLCGVVVPFVSFVVLLLFGPRLGKPMAGWVAVAGMGASCVLATIVLVGWMGEVEAGTAAQISINAAYNQFHWASIGSVPVRIGIKLDSLTVIMFFMVSFVSFWIFVFSVGYMSGHSDEVGGKSKFHRFFCYLSLFGFSMLGLVVSSNLLFLFIFWELVGLCSYFLIGFYFDKKFASDAAMKAFITNRVGDFGFLFGLMMVFFFLKTLDLDQAAANFAEQFNSKSGLFDENFVIDLFGWHISGMTLATMMGIGLFCGAIGKSAQFPLQVWLPDAMAGPTPVSALIHAATMVAAGVYLVARVYRLLTPDAQFFIAVIGCITLTSMALVAIVQVDIKKCLAYSTLSQLGYMIFGMGVGAWIAALFHLMTHAFFKAMMFLGSGQVIEGCHHEQDMRKMGGLIRKMPMTGLTFLVGVLAISGVGIPTAHIGLGGYFSKDEILAVAWHRTYTWNEPVDEHAGAAGRPAGVRLASDNGQHKDSGAVSHGERAGGKAGIMARVDRLPKWMFWCALITAYITPFYMMRAWWMTFMGKPRDEHVHKHAHESPLMWVPLVVLAVFTLVSSYWWFRPLIADAAPAATDAAVIVGLDGVAESSLEAHGELIDVHGAHDWLAIGVGGSWLISFIVAILIYRNGLSTAARLKAALGPIATLLEKKYYFDEMYGFFLVKGCLAFAYVCRFFDTYVIDMFANLSAKIIERLAAFSGRGVDANVVDGVYNGLAATSMDVSNLFRSPQTGRIRNYLLFAASGAAIVILLLLLLLDGSRGGDAVLLSLDL